MINPEKQLEIFMLYNNLIGINDKLSFIKSHPNGVEFWQPNRTTDKDADILLGNNYAKMTIELCKNIKIADLLYCIINAMPKPLGDIEQGFIQGIAEHIQPK